MLKLITVKIYVNILLISYYKVYHSIVIYILLLLVLKSANDKETMLEN